MNQTSLATNHRVVVGCKKLLQKVESSSTLCNKICSCCAFYRPQQMLYNKGPISCASRNSHIILSNQNSVFTQGATTWFVARQVGLAYSACRSARKNRLFCSKFCSDILILLEFCSLSEKNFGPSGRIYFCKYRREPGPNPKKKKKKKDVHYA